MLPWEVATGTLTAGAVLAYQEIGLLAVALLAVCSLLPYLLRAVIEAQPQRDELRAQVQELEALHHGVIRVMVETLGMRDRMTARHSAAVARFAKATAAAAGLSVARAGARAHGRAAARRRQVHVPRPHADRHAADRGGLGADPLAPAARRRHRRRVHGYAEVAEIVLCHHERIDGRGYPRSLSGDDIPVLARILSVADCFDVMTARDSYRTPMPFDVAIAELRRVAGTQLDARIRRDLRRPHDQVRSGLPSRGRRRPRGRARSARRHGARRRALRVERAAVIPPDSN